MSNAYNIQREESPSMTAPVTILLVEDNDGHARLIEKNLRRSGITNQIIRASNGFEAIEYLFGEKKKLISVRQILIMLDLNLPFLTGIQVLERVKENEETKHIPVVVLTTTDDYKEMKKCYELGCNLYMTKPIDYDQFSEAIRKLGLLFSVLVTQRPGDGSGQPGQ